MTKKIDPKELPQKIEEIDKILTREKNKVYKANEINISSFGIQVRRLMVKNNLVEQNMRTLTNNNLASLQFQLTGSAYNFSTFLKDVSTNDKYWKIEELFIKSAKQYATVDVTMRITYETANP
jgi:ADP-glucose pyrophosphorylase